MPELHGPVDQFTETETEVAALEPKIEPSPLRGSKTHRAGNKRIGRLGTTHDSTPLVSL
jgi:hypothetical protein